MTRVFNKCKACHSALDTKNKIGPSLLGIVGKPAGEVTGYKYSKALLSSGVIWNEESLDVYLEKPKKFCKTYCINRFKCNNSVGRYCGISI